MSTKWKRLAAGTMAAATCVAVAACGSGGSSNAAGGAGEITVYNAQHENLTKAWVDEFTKETGIKVNLRNGEDTEMANQLIAEGTNSPADVFLTENSPAMDLVAQAGLLTPVDKDTLAQVPAQYRPANGDWTGIAARSTVFVYNKDKLKPEQLPKSMTDLEKPEWKGRWGASPSGADFQAIVSAYLQLKGEPATKAWLAGMKQNAKAYKGNMSVMKAVNAGQIDGGIIYHYYWFGDQAQGGQNSNNTQLEYFKNEDPGAFVSVSGGGVLKSSKHQQQAQEFLKFITGKKGQQILQNGGTFEYPVASGVPANDKLVPLDQLQAPKIDPSTLNSKKVTELMTQAGLI